MTVATNAFQRWMVRCMAAAGVSGLQPTDVQILHTVNHRDREMTLADLCMMFNIEDTHVVSYALKKLEGLGLIETGRRGKEKTVRVTESGAAACDRYRKSGRIAGFRCGRPQVRGKRDIGNRRDIAGIVRAVRSGGSRRSEHVTRPYGFGFNLTQIV